MKFKIAIAKGDGIGPEVTDEAMSVLNKTGEKFDHQFEYEEVLVGGASIDENDVPLTDETIQICRNSDSVLLGAVGGPKWDHLPGDKRPEKAILGLRSELGLFANLRPAMMFAELSDACPLKTSLIEGGLDIMVVRELTGGIYFGERGTKETPEGLVAYDIEQYSENEIRRIAVTAFDMAEKRNNKVTSIDKANVLDSSRLWRKVVSEVHKDYPDIELEHMYVDNGAMQLVRNPKQFDVIVTNNIFGDILSDEASQITGSIGMLPSASLAEGNFGLYEPIHGSAPDISNQDKANPIATILSAAMMLRYSFGLKQEADAVENAVSKFLSDGYRTPDIHVSGTQLVGTAETGAKIKERI